MFNAKDLILGYGQEQTALLAFDFFLLRIFGGNSRRHHDNLRDSFS